MKLYCDPISTTSRPVLMFIAEQGLEVEIVKVDLMAGGSKDPEYLAINPNGVVPFLVDGDFKLGESAAILKYLAIRSHSTAYPESLEAQTKVDEAISSILEQTHLGSSDGGNAVLDRPHLVEFASFSASVRPCTMNLACSGENARS